MVVASILPNEPVPLATLSPANVGESPVCNPLSTSVFTPFVANLIVPCEGLLATELLTIPAFKFCMAEAVTESIPVN